LDEEFKKLDDLEDKHEYKYKNNENTEAELLQAQVFGLESCS